MGLVAGVVSYALDRLYVAQRDAIPCNAMYTGALALLVAIGLFLTIAFGAGYLSTDGRSGLGSAVLAGAIVAVLGGVGSFAALPEIISQAERIDMICLAPGTLGPSVTDARNALIGGQFVGFILGGIFAIGAAAAGYALKRASPTT
jgi:hypothetical protein